MARQSGNGRHRLGTPALVHCIEHPEVAAALKSVRRPWLTALLTPAKHSLAGLRRRAANVRRAHEIAAAPS